jgi:hypothetical protein
MLQEHINSRGFKTAFSEARLKKYVESLKLPVMDGLSGSDKEMLTMDSKIIFLATTKDMDDIVEAFKKVAKNTGGLARG